MKIGLASLARLTAVGWSPRPTHGESQELLTAAPFGSRQIRETPGELPTCGWEIGCASLRQWMACDWSRWDWASLTPRRMGARRGRRQTGRLGSGFRLPRQPMAPNL